MSGKIEELNKKGLTPRGFVSFLRINPPSFTGSSTTKVPEIIVEDLKKVFDKMHVIDV